MARLGRSYLLVRPAIRRPASAGAEVTGTAAGSATASGTVTGTRTVYGAVTGSATASGTVTGVRTVYGVCSGSATASGTATGGRTIYGVALGAAIAAGAASGTRTVAGTATGSATASGEVVAALITPPRSHSVLIWQRKRGSMITNVVATIAASASASNEIDLRNARLLAIQMPTAWTAAVITFTARPGLTDNPGSNDNDALQSVVNDAGTEVSITATASKYISTVGAVRDALDGVGYIKVNSGTAASAVAQAAARRLVLVVESSRG